MPVHVGEEFTKRVTLSESDIAEFARMCGDGNPLHSDPAHAAGTRFGGIIACGPHYASLLMGLAATRFSTDGAMLGLEFTFHFRRPVRPGDVLDLTWKVVAATPKASLRGDIVSLEGRIVTAEGMEVLGASGKVLVTDRL